MGDYSTSVLAFAGAARLAVHRGDLRGGATPAHTRHAGPAGLHDRRARDGRSGAAPAREGVPGAWPTTRPSATCCARSTTSCATGPPWAPSWTRWRTFRDSVTSVQAGAAGATPLSPAELRLLPYLQTHLMMREIAERLFVSRNTVSSAGELDLSQAGRLLPPRGRGARDRDGPARRLIGHDAADPVSRGLLGVVAQCHGERAGAAATTRGSPTIGHDGHEHVDDLGAGGAGAHRGVGLGAVGGHLAADRDQGGQLDRAPASSDRGRTGPRRLRWRLLLPPRRR